MPKISNNELDNDYYNLISLDYDGFVFDIKYNNLGYVEICNTSYNERLLSREKYTHFIVQIDDNSIHVYADSKKIISCQQSIALCKNRRFSIVIGHDSNDDGAYPCFVNDFYLVMDKISSDEAINIANLSNSIKNLYDYHSLLKESQIHHQNKLIFKRNFTYMTDNININNGQTKYKIGKSLITSERFKLKDNEKECTYEYNDANLLKKYNNPITQQYISYTYDSFID